MVLLTTRYYLKRAFTNPLQVALMTLLPAVIVFINVAMNINIIAYEGGYFMFEGYDIMATVITMFVMLMFQAMSGVYAGEFVFQDFKEANRWRLRAAPVSSGVFVTGAVVASTIFSFVTALIILGISFIAYDIYLGNLAVILATVFFLALWAQFVGIIIAMFVKKKGAIDGITIALSFAMSIMAGGFMFNVPMPQFARDFIIPTGVAIRAVTSTNILQREIGDTGMAESLTSIAILAGMAIVFGVAAFALARRRAS
ncbi:MAG: ABC transporter permease [Oscillospiraceae bacterium]|nr:ABC transporter permease [Oscillospiraceae bacterium]